MEKKNKKRSEFNIDKVKKEKKKKKRQQNINV